MKGRKAQKKLIDLNEREIELQRQVKSHLQMVRETKNRIAKLEVERGKVWAILGKGVAKLEEGDKVVVKERDECAYVRKVRIVPKETGKGYEALYYLNVSKKRDGEMGKGFYRDIHGNVMRPMKEEELLRLDQNPIPPDNYT